MTLEEIAAEMRRYAEAHPHKVVGAVHRPGAGHTRRVAVDGHEATVTLGLVVMGTVPTYQLWVDLREPGRPPVPNRVLYAIRSVLLPGGTQITLDGDPTRRYIQALR